MTLVTGYTKAYIDTLTTDLKYNTFSRKTAHYILALVDVDTVVEMNVATPNNLTIPPNSDVAFPIGTRIEATQYGTGLTTIVAGSGVTLRSLGGFLTSAGQFSKFKFEKVATNEWYVSGDLV